MELIAKRVFYLKSAEKIALETVTKSTRIVIFNEILFAYNPAWLAGKKQFRCLGGR